MDSLRRLISDALSALGRLSPRERGLVSLAGGAVLVFLVAMVTLSVSRSIERQETRIKTKQGQLDEVGKLTGNFRAEEQRRKDLEARLAQGKDTKLLGYIEELSKRDGLSIGGMTPKGTQPLEGGGIVEDSVEVTFTRIQLDKLVKFLSDVESGKGVIKVSRLQVRPRTDEAVLDAWLVVTLYLPQS